MKDTGLSWIPDIPSHWDVRRAKLILHEVDSRSTTGAELLLSVSQYTGVTPRRTRENSDEQDTRSESLVGYKQVAKGDLVVNIMLAWNGSLGASSYEGVVSPAYCVYRFQGDNLPDYYHHLLRTDAYKGRIKVDSRGVVDSRLRLYSENLFRIELPVPPPEEQAQIVRFIRHLDHRVNRLIKTKRRLIELLNEQKQAIIHRAVTRGLDPTVPLKPSGIDWLGDIPSHWKLVRLKSIAAIRYGLGQPPKELEGGLPIIRATNIERGRITMRGMLYVDPSDVPASRDALLRAGEILVVRSGAYTADSAIVTPEFEGAVAGYDMVVRPKGVECEFLAWALLSRYVLQDQLFLLRSRAAQPHLNAEELGGCIILLPPVAEQTAIIETVRRETAALSEAMDKARSEIDLIREYRTRLVADVVTGQLDVRHLDLPEVEESLSEATEAGEDEEVQEDGEDTE